MVNKDRGAFYVGKLLSAFNLFRYEDAVADYEKAICDKRNTDICRASLFLNGTYAFFMTQQYDRCRECGEKYLELYETWHADEKKIIDEAAFFVRDAFDRENLEKTYSYLILSGLRQKQDRELHRYFPCISLQPELDRIYFYPPLVPELIAYWSETEYDRRFSDYADIQQSGGQENPEQAEHRQPNRRSDDVEREMDQRGPACVFVRAH